MVSYKKNWQKLSYFDGFCLGAAVAAAEYITSIYLAKGMLSFMALGLLTSLPSALGAILQCCLPLLGKTTNARNLTLVAIVIQAFGLGMMGYGLFDGSLNIPIMFVGLVGYWCGTMLGNATFLDWSVAITPATLFPRFYAARQGWIVGTTLGVYLVIGCYTGLTLPIALVCYGLFGAAALRFLSLAICCQLPHPSVSHVERQPTQDFRSDFKPLLWIMASSFLFRLAVGYSAPYYNSYMLQELHLSIMQFVFLTAVPLATRILILPRWSQLLERNGHFEGLVIALLVVGFIPIFWAVSASQTNLFTLQVASGIGWSGYDMIALLLVQRLAPPQKTLLALSGFIGAGAIGQVVGSALGGLSLAAHHNYLGLFFFSGVGRLLGAGVLLYALRRYQLFRFSHLAVKRHARLLFFPQRATTRAQGDRAA